MSNVGRSVFHPAFGALAATALLGVPVAAQDIRDLDGETSDIRAFSGTIGEDAELFSITMPAGTALQIDATPGPDSEIDPVLLVRDADTNEILAQDDDGGEGISARARIYSETQRRLLIELTDFEQLGSGGNYELFVRTTNWRPVEPQTVTWGSEVSGTISDSAEHLFVFSGEEGYLLDVRLEAAEGSEIDTMLELFEGEGTDGGQLTSNDDSGEGTDSRIRYLIPEDGLYTIRATGFDGAQGDYVLTIGPRLEKVEPAAPQAMILGSSVSATIGSGFLSEDGGDVGAKTVIFRFDQASQEAIRAGQGQVTFEMIVPEDIASDVDPLIELGFDTPLGFTVVASDDDGGEGLNSRLAIDLGPLTEEPGWLERLELHASSLGDETGGFQLRVSEGLMTASEDEAEPATD